MWAINSAFDACLIEGLSRDNIAEAISTATRGFGGTSTTCTEAYIDGAMFSGKPYARKYEPL